MVEQTSYAPALAALGADVINEARQLLAAELGIGPAQLSDEELCAYLMDLFAEPGNSGLETCIQALFERQVEHTPEATAVIAVDGRLTYWELNARANQVARYLRQFDVGPDVLVGICAERSLAMVVGILGILKAGGAYVPLDPTYPHERLAFMLQDTAVPILLTQQRLLDQLPAHTAHTVCLDADWPQIARQSRDNLAAHDMAGHLAYMIYTSGSTSTPKGVMITHASLVHYVQAMREPLDISAADVYLHTASFAFSSSVRQLMVPFSHGASVVVATAEQIGHPVALFELIKQQGVTIADLIPSYWRNCIDALDHLDATTRAGLLNSQLRRICSASEPLLSDIPNTWAHEFAHPASLMNMFGQTETTGIVAVFPIPRQPTGRARIVGIGRPIAGTQIYLLDTNLQLVPPGIAGEVYIGGTGLARGYLNQPGLTAERFIPDPFSGTPGARLYKTGDLARCAADGSLEFLGRIDHQVKIRGVRVELGEVEGALREYAAVRDAVVVVREDSPGDRRLVAYVVPKDEGGRMKDEKGVDSSFILHPSSFGPALRAYLKEKLPTYMIPSVFVVLEALPRMPNGKVKRHGLPPPDHTRPELARIYVAPRTPAEEQLAGIWAKVLQIEQVGVYDNFFDLGGDSILAIQVIARANQAGLPITPRQLFQHATLVELASAAGRAPAIQAEQGPVIGPVPLTPSQHWFFELDLPAPHHFNQAYLFEVHLSLEPPVVERALRHVLEHHDALRMRFVHEGGGWWQHNAGIEGPVPFAWFDVSNQPEDEQRQAIEAAAAQLQASLDLEHGPLVRVALFDLGAGRPSRLLIIVHHLVMDGVSRRIVLEDLYTACWQLNAGQPVLLPPKTTAFKHWAERLSSYAQASELHQELDYWLAAPRTQITPLPVDHSGGAYTLDSSDVVSVVLNAEETHALLRDVPRAYHTEINALLLAAVLHAFTDWTGVPTLLVDLVGHGREPLFDDVDLSRTVGWCSATFPVLLERPIGAIPDQTLRVVHEQLRQVPNRGAGYGLLRSMSNDPALIARLQAMPQPQVVFSYTGQFDQTLADSPLFALAHESIGPAQDPHGAWPYLLDIYAHVIGGQLTVNWLYSTHVHRRATIEQLANGFVATLRDILAAPAIGGLTAHRQNIA